MTMARLDDPDSFHPYRGRHRQHDRYDDRYEGRRQSPQHDYYDPDHEYRARRPGRDTDHEPYGNWSMPGEYIDRGHDRRSTRRLSDEEHAWSDPSSWYGGGAHRGVGPKGYVRSDERIRELVCDDLMDDAWLDASQIEVSVKDGEVMLSGTVANRDARRLAGSAKHICTRPAIVSSSAAGVLL
jgi:hypothetical protein